MRTMGGLSVGQMPCRRTSLDVASSGDVLTRWGCMQYALWTGKFICNGLLRSYLSTGSARCVARCVAINIPRSGSPRPIASLHWRDMRKCCQFNNIIYSLHPPLKPCRSTLSAWNTIPTWADGLYNTFLARRVG